MGLFFVFGLLRRVKRLCFVIFVVAAVYAGPRFARDMVNEVGNDDARPATSLP